MNKLSQETNNPFWKDVFNAYSKILNNQIIKTNEDLLANPLWYNNRIFTYNLYYKSWSRSGINYVYDIVRDNHQIRTLDELKQNFNNNNLKFYDYYRIYKAIQKFINDNANIINYHINRPIIPYHLKILYNHLKGTSDFYKLLTYRPFNLNCAKKWNNELNKYLDETTWRQIFKIAQNTIQDNYYKYFQYRLIHRILPTRSLLIKMNKSNTDLCHYCNNAIETLLHLFTQCPITNRFWQNINRWIHRKTRILIPLDNYNKLFGYLNNDNTTRALNTIYILVRSYIFTTSKLENTLLVSVFQRKLTIIYQEQYLLAKLNNKNLHFENSWARLLPLMDEE